MRVLLLITLLLSNIGLLAFSYKHQVSVCAMFQDEALFLKEWLEFHILVGVEHFYLYNNLSTDNYLEILAPYIEQGKITLIDWPYLQDNWMPLQLAANQDALKRAMGVTKWLAFIDLDEFLVPVNDDTLQQFLKRYKKIGGIGVNWVMYGTSFVPKVKKNTLQIESLLYRAADDARVNLHIKSIVRTKYVDGVYHLHFPSYKPGYFSVTSDYTQFVGPFSPKLTISEIRINHYWCRDEDYFYNVKLPRRQKLGEDVSRWIRIKDSYSTVKDEAIMKFVPELRKRLGLVKK